ncbi:MAG: monooxygenase [Phycisphaeraceae bacterium]|nr:monooxygenase [Phycisphaeraceae bacterium]
MSKTALCVRHRAKPGHRDDVRRVWEQYVKPRASRNPAHEAYFFCFDDEDPDVVIAFQLLSSSEAVESFMPGDWYPQYLDQVGEHIQEPPRITRASPLWIKHDDPVTRSK